MFSTGEAPARTVGFFGSLYVAASEGSSGATDVSMGVANPTALVVIFTLFSVGLLLTQVLYEALKQYRVDLIAARAGAA